jgi:hypothetical protein
MGRINVAVRCEEKWQNCAVQAICEGSWAKVLSSDTVSMLPITYLEDGSMFNWFPQKPKVPVMSFEEFVIEYGELMHEVKGEWRPDSNEAVLFTIRLLFYAMI